MGKVRVNGIKVHAYHGCIPEEAIIGGPFQVDVAVTADFSKAAKSDQLEDAVDYVAVNDIVHREMKQRSKLIEHVGQRIIDAIHTELNGVEKVELHIQKLHPPLNADLHSVSVEMEG